MPIHYIGRDELITINKEVVRISGDPHGVLSDANLDHVIGALRFKYENDADAVLLKAAFLLDYVANKGHIFIEGNKLGLNSMVFTEANQEQLAGFVLSVARNEQSLKGIAAWLKQRIKRIETT